MERWATLEGDFVSYYKSQWHGKLQNWVKAYRCFPHANQNTNGSIERYHRTLKSQLKRDKKVKMGRRVSWLVEKLMEDVEHWYWMKAGMKIQGRVRNSVAENFMIVALDKARLIPDADVDFGIMDGSKYALFISQSNREEVHLVLDYDSEMCTCTCAQGIEENTCKHQVCTLDSMSKSSYFIDALAGFIYRCTRDMKDLIVPMITFTDVHCLFYASSLNFQRASYLLLPH
jgi:hypothetical protein